MAESQEDSIVYLEDIETQPNTQPTQSQSDASTSSATSQTTSSSLAVGGKRQRTLMDMFSGSQPAKASAPASKKLKLTASEPALPTKNASAVSGFKNQRLNAIPFSLSQYQESLSADQRNLLALECAYIGKSWCVAAIAFARTILDETIFRLKVLKDEIKKPYFIALKKFLWEEGVRGPDEIPKSLKIYPSRKCESKQHIADLFKTLNYSG
jgi:uracil-DNA glycosylase